MLIKRLVSVFRAGGASAVLSAIVRRVRMPHARSFSLARQLIRGKTGLEIGGPSPIFSRGGLLPIYPHAARIDNCNFARRTIWEGEIEVSDEPTFRAGRTPGRQFVAEGGSLGTIADESYGFVLSSHMIEHTANPVGTLNEWARILQPSGVLVLIVPHRDGTFDHRRTVTSLEHLLHDAKRSTGEDDLTHIDEILAHHDLTRDAGASDVASFSARAFNNMAVRSMHHHVFDSRLVVAMLAAAGFVVVSVEAVLPYHVFAIAVKPPSDVHGDLSDGQVDAALRESPFVADRA